MFSGSRSLHEEVCVRSLGTAPHAVHNQQRVLWKGGWLFKGHEGLGAGFFWESSEPPRAAWLRHALGSAAAWLSFVKSRSGGRGWKQSVLQHTASESGTQDSVRSVSRTNGHRKLHVTKSSLRIPLVMLECARLPCRLSPHTELPITPLSHKATRAAPPALWSAKQGWASLSACLGPKSGRDVNASLTAPRSTRS